MTRLLYYVTSFVGICFFTTLSLPGVASEADVAVTVTDEEKTASALELGYGVLAYECDTQMQELAEEDKVAKIEGTIYTKIVGTVIRICFVPNQAALDAGIGLKEINNFKWETINKRGDDLRRDAITNGTGDGMLSTVRCLTTSTNNSPDQDDDPEPLELEGHSVCLLESMLTSEFYIDTATVTGSGEAIFHTKKGVDIGTVPVGLGIFLGKFSFEFDPQTEELLQSMQEQNYNATALDSNSTSTDDEDEDETESLLSTGEENDVVSNSDDDTNENDNEDEDEGKDEL